MGGGDFGPVLPGTHELAAHGDLAAEMVAGISAFLDRALAEADAAARPAELADPARAAARRAELACRLGVVDPRVSPIRLEVVADAADLDAVPAPGAVAVAAVRWPVLEGVDGEGLWLRPRGGPALARVVALPDADLTPEQLCGLGGEAQPCWAYALRLAERGCEVIVPALVDRGVRWGHGRPHREYVWRMAFELGRHIVGYEVQRVLALVDLWADRGIPLGVCGYGEGGLIALHAAALDPRLGAALVSGHFRNRRQVWREPVYRDVWGLLRGFGDAELAALIAPRGLVVEATPGPLCPGPPSGQPGNPPGGLSAGSLTPAPPAEVAAEVDRARGAFALLGADGRLVHLEGAEAAGGPGGEPALCAFLALCAGVEGPPMPPKAPEPPAGPLPGAHSGRAKRQFRQLCNHVQGLLAVAEGVRTPFWAEAERRDPQLWAETRRQQRQRMHEELIGRCPDPSVPANPRSRRVHDRPLWQGYEVVMDVWPGVVAGGILLLPRDLRPGERRPVVVCQHGLEGRAVDTLAGAPGSPYADFAARLADLGYIVYAPQNPYVGGEAFRVINRKAHPLGWSLFSVITAQHARTLQWLASLPWVDPARIALYGLSYGGKTAMRVPALLEGYCLSICSADFNEWLVKCAGEDPRFSYLQTIEYDMYEWNLGHTFNYAEMAGLIAPRPFMVERGHDDGVGLDQWVAYEYARVRRLYARLGLSERTEIAFFDGGHRIDGERSFAFLQRHLGQPRLTP